MLMVKPPKRRAGERGALAIMSLAAISCMLFLMFAMVELGLKWVHTARMTAQAEALAAANGLQTILVDSPNFRTVQSVDKAQLQTLNSALAGDDAVVDIQAVSSSIPNDQVTPLDLATYTTVTVSGSHQSLVPGLMPSQFTTESVKVSAAVSQFSANTLTIIPPRYVILADYGDSMSLYMSDQNGGVTTVTALDLLKAGLDLILSGQNDPTLHDNVNWGFIPFSDKANMNDAVAPLDCATATLADLPSHTEAVRAKIASTGIQSANKTNITDAIAQARAFVSTSSSPLCADPFFILLSDGEPSDDGSNNNDPSTYAARVDAARGFSQAAAANASNANNISMISVLINRPQAPSYATGVTSEQFMEQMACNVTDTGGHCGSAPARFHPVIDTVQQLNTFANNFATDGTCTFLINNPPAGSLTQQPILSPNAPIGGYWVRASSGVNETKVDSAINEGGLNTIDPALASNINASIVPRYWVGRLPGQGTSSPMTVKLNTPICRDYQTALRNGTRSSFHFRLRWGYPFLRNYQQPQQ